MPLFPRNRIMNHDIWCRLPCFLPANSTGTFLSYMIVSAFTLVFVVLWVPETKGRTLEEIQWSFRWGLHALSRCNHPMILRVFLLEGNGWFVQLEILGIPPSTNTRWRPRILSVHTPVCTFLCNAVKIHVNAGALTLTKLLSCLKYCIRSRVHCQSCM